MTWAVGEGRGARDTVRIGRKNCRGTGNQKQKNPAMKSRIETGGTGIRGKKRRRKSRGKKSVGSKSGGLGTPTSEVQNVRKSQSKGSPSWGVKTSGDVGEKDSVRLRVGRLKGGSGGTRRCQVRTDTEEKNPRTWRAKKKNRLEARKKP